MNSFTPDPARPSPPYSRRIATIRRRLAQLDLDALLVTHPPNLRYLAGFDGSTGALLVSASACLLIVDGRYVTAARSRLGECGELREVAIEMAPRSCEEAVASALRRWPHARRVGVEADSLTIGRFNRVASLIGEASRGDEPSAIARLIPTERLVEQLRLVKDASEIATIRRAASMLSGVAGLLASLLRPGRTERDIAGDIDSAVRSAGFDRPAFDTIVASGPNSALPHARPGTRLLTPGDPVLLDFGGVYDGYCVDLTRTVQLAPGTAAFRQLLDAVGAAQAAAIAAVRPGVKASEVDAAARAVLADRGLADAFVHGTGHGLGLEVHEGPRIGRAGTVTDETILPDMVFTIEPGAYVPGVGGVRIEDDVLVREEGCEVLTNAPIGFLVPLPIPAAES